MGVDSRIGNASVDIGKVWVAPPGAQNPYLTRQFWRNPYLTRALLGHLPEILTLLGLYMYSTKQFRPNPHLTRPSAHMNEPMNFQSRSWWQLEISEIFVRMEAHIVHFWVYEMSVHISPKPTEC